MLCALQLSALDCTHVTLPACAPQQSYSVLDAMASTHRMKLDTDADSLYCSLVAFSLLNPPGDGTSDALAEQHSNSFYRKRNRQLREPLLPISEHQAHQQRTISSRVRSGSTTSKQPRP